MFLTHNNGWAKESTGYVVKSVALSGNAIITTFPAAPQVNNPCRIQATNTWTGNTINPDSANESAPVGTMVESGAEFA